MFLKITIVICFFVYDTNSWEIRHNFVNSKFDKNDVDYEGGAEMNPRINLIFPGTKWCGSGNIANGFEDLGKYKETDMCCRTHDFCEDILEAGESKNGLKNDAFYTRLNCQCDQLFYNCLRSVNDMVSMEVGFTYFSVLNTQCFQFEYPIVNCTKYHNTIRSRCKTYLLDSSKEKAWQWFDVPLY